MNEVGTRAIERPTDFTFPDQEAASPPILFLSLFSRQGKVKENRERRRERHRGVKKSDPRICNREGGGREKKKGTPLSSLPNFHLAFHLIPFIPCNPFSRNSFPFRILLADCFTPIFSNNRDNAIDPRFFIRMIRKFKLFNRIHPFFVDFSHIYIYQRSTVEKGEEKKKWMQSSSSLHE